MKTCPFCGAEAFVDMIMTSQFTMWYVRCSNCLSSTAPKTSKEKAIESWELRFNNKLNADRAKVTVEKANGRKHSEKEQAIKRTTPCATTNKDTVERGG